MFRRNGTIIGLGDPFGEQNFMPTIRDVADKAGVAPSTVSLVLNGRKSVSGELRAAILEAAESLSYTRRKKGRPRKDNIPTGTPRIQSVKHQVAFLFPEAIGSLRETYLRSSVMRGIELACRRIDFNMVVQSVSSQDPVKAASLASQVDGAVFVGESPVNVFSDLLARIPCVRLLGSPVEGEPWDHVTYNNTMLGRIAADYLLERGHKVAACLVPDPQVTPSSADHFMTTPFARLSKERFHTFVARMQSAGATAFGNTVWFKGARAYTPDAFRPILAEIFKRHPRPTGLFVPQDMLTMTVYPALNAFGLRPGRDVDVVSCDNDLWALGALDPKPATIELQSECIGRHGVERILARLADATLPRVVMTLEPKLVLPDQPGASQ